MFRAIFIVSLAGLFVWTALPAFAGPALTIAPSSGHPNVAVSVSGTGFGDYEAVDVYVDLTDTLLLSASSTGAITGSVTIPANASPGTHYVTAVGRHTGTSAQKAFTVTTPWAEFGFGYAHQGANPFENTLATSNIASAGMLWTDATEALGGTVAVVGGRAYVSLDSGVEALSASTGAVIWKTLTGKQFAASPTVLGGVVYVGAITDNTLYALNATTGAKIWSKTFGNVIYSAVSVINGMVYVGSSDDNVYALKASTGAVVWSYPTKNHVVSTPTVVGGIVYVGSDDHSVYALNATSGKLVWSYPTDGSVESSPAVYNGVVYIGSDDGYIYALSAPYGSLIWAYETNGSVYAAPAVFDNTVYAGSIDGNMYALNSQSGALQWKLSTGNVVRSAVVANGIVYFTSDNDTLYAANASYGGIVASAFTDSSYLGSPSVSDGVVYVSTYFGSTYAFSLSSSENTGSARPFGPPPAASLHPDLSLPVTRLPAWAPESEPMPTFVPAGTPARASRGAALSPAAPTMRRFSGTVQGARGALLIVRLRNGRTLRIDTSGAFAHTPPSLAFFIGKPFTFEGQVIAGNVMATKIDSIVPGARNWPPDR